MNITSLLFSFVAILFLSGCRDEGPSTVTLEPNEPQPISSKKEPKSTDEVAVKKATTKLSNTIVMELKYGFVEIELNPDLAPNHVKRIKELTNAGFYDGIVFHRVIEGFMAQTGDPTGTGTGGSKKPDLKAEFNDTDHVRGVVSMARSSNPNSANSQFFIVLADAPHLNGQYTAFGRVVKGMRFVDRIKKGAPGSGAVDNPDKIIKMRLK